MSKTRCAVKCADCGQSRIVNTDSLQRLPRRCRPCYLKSQRNVAGNYRERELLARIARLETALAAALAPPDPIDAVRKRLRAVLVGVKKRCRDARRAEYKNYGGRGVKVSPEFEKFEDFYRWALGAGYEAGLTLERVNNDGDYSPDNCCWATRKEQRANQRK